MSSNLIGKAVECIKLYAVTSGCKSNLKVITAKQNDFNSRYIHIKLYDARKQIDCTDCTVRANFVLESGDNYYCFGELIDSEIYIKLPTEILKETGKVSADVTLTKKIDEVSVLIGSSVGITDAYISDEDTFISAVGSTSGAYYFTYGTVDETEGWILNDEIVDAETYGVAIEGTPVAGDTFCVEYEALGQLTSETFYILVQENQYQEDIEIASNELDVYNVTQLIKTFDELKESYQTNYDALLAEYEELAEQIGDLETLLDTLIDGDGV